jgi:hypothetical protein
MVETPGGIRGFSRHGNDSALNILFPGSDLVLGCLSCILHTISHLGSLRMEDMGRRMNHRRSIEGEELEMDGVIYMMELKWCQCWRELRMAS